MEKRIFKDKVYSILANMIKAMANPHRLEIVDLLGQGEKSVEEIATETNMSMANASQHLQVLKAANLVEIRREKNFIHYRLAHEKIYESWQNLRELGMERVAGIEKLINDFRNKKHGLEPIGLEELMKRLKSKNIVLLDVRPEREYRIGHIPQAINIPLEELSTKLKRLLKSKEYIAYCRGTFCVFADEAVNILSKKGFKARRLVEGFPDWKAKGFKVEVIHN
jgi:rhodanese-related sulfurtransferase/predicted transcriptional regulator